MRLGLPPVHFSMKSLRSGAITCLNSAGVDQEVIENQAGHSHKADTSKKFYDHFTSQAGGGRGESIGPSAVSQDVTFNVDKLTKLLPQSSNSQASSKQTSDKSVGKATTKRGKPRKGNNKNNKSKATSSLTKQI